MTTIRKGDVVTFLPQWRDKGDENRQFVAIENEIRGSVGVRDETSTLFINPWQSVRVSMIETVNGQPYGGAE